MIFYLKQQIRLQITLLIKFAFITLIIAHVGNSSYIKDYLIFSLVGIRVT